MIGFFEYQYLKYKKNHLKNLVAMAAIDGHIHEDEINYLYQIGEKYQLKPQQIKRILDKREEIEPEIPEHVETAVRPGLAYTRLRLQRADGHGIERPCRIGRRRFALLLQAVQDGQDDRHADLGRSGGLPHL